MVGFSLCRTAIPGLHRPNLEKVADCYRRSLVEIKMRCLKLLGERVIARDFDRQVAELQVRAAVLNGFMRLGRPMTEPMP